MGRNSNPCGAARISCVWDLVIRESGQVIDASGRIARNFYYIGPMLWADRWEVTAVQELRECAEHLARGLLTSLRLSKSTFRLRGPAAAGFVVRGAAPQMKFRLDGKNRKLLSLMFS
jgi:hypothetical protein